jgi:N utilization substance protein A
MYSTVQSIEGITEQMADKLAALGMVSVFDIEEVGQEVLMTELEIDEAKAAQVVEVCSVKAKEVAAQQQKDKEEKERKAKEEQALAQKLLAEGGTPDAGEAGEAAAAAILGVGSAGAPAEPAKDVSPDADARAADILGQG